VQFVDARHCTFNHFRDGQCNHSNSGQRQPVADPWRSATPAHNNAQISAHDDSEMLVDLGEHLSNILAYPICCIPVSWLTSPVVLEYSVDGWRSALPNCVLGPSDSNENTSYRTADESQQQEPSLNI
jgi:hypothetical protein